MHTQQSRAFVHATQLWIEEEFYGEFYVFDFPFV